MAKTKKQIEEEAKFLLETANAGAKIVREFLVSCVKAHVEKNGKLDYPQLLAIFIEMNCQLLEDVADSLDSDIQQVVSHFEQGLDMWVEKRTSNNNKEKEN